MDHQRPPQLTKPNGESRCWLKIYDDKLDPGGNAMATVMQWSSGSLVEVDSTIEHRSVYDPLYRVFALKDEFIEAVWNKDNEHWETVCPSGLQRKGKLTGTLSHGGSAGVDIWAFSAVSSPLVNVTAFDWFLLSTDPDMATGTRIDIRFDSADQKWLAVGGACGAE